jgi:hypothetical protein
VSELPRLLLLLRVTCEDPSLVEAATHVALLALVPCRMFYFFFESRGQEDDPVVIWLTGGPGCSSELALFYENGPFNIADNLSLVWNDFGWDKVHMSYCSSALPDPLTIYRKKIRVWILERVQMFSCMLSLWKLRVTLLLFVCWLASAGIKSYLC